LIRWEAFPETMKIAILLYRQNISRTAALLMCSIVLFSLASNPAWGQEMEIPARDQFPFFLKILSFERNLKCHGGKEMVMGILYEAGFEKSLRAKREMEQAVQRAQVKRNRDPSIHCVPIEVGRETDLGRALARAGVRILYVAPVQASCMKEVTRISRAQQVLTLTGVPEYAESGVSVAISKKGHRPSIIINLGAARAEGADFDSRLLKLAKIVRDKE
jgi:hypothetical protein